MRSPASFPTAALLAAALLGAAAAPAAAQGPPTLTGENLTASEPTFPASSDVETSNATCDREGTSTFSFFATGPANGPYPGTFTETGTVTIGPQNETNPIFFGSGSVISLEVEFTIDSPLGQVTGTKSVTIPDDPTLPNNGTCTSFFDHPELGTGTRRAFSSQHATYDARIVTADGTFFDRGTSSIGLFHTSSNTVESSGFNETFVSALTEVEPELPARRGKGCGDLNHVHERRAECKKA